MRSAAHYKSQAIAAEPELEALASEFSHPLEHLLAAHADKRRPVDEIRRRLEAGERFTASGYLSTRHVIPPGWGTTRDAEAILPGIQSAAQDENVTLPRRPSGKRARSARGCGWLWHLPTVRRIKQIRMASRIDTRSALRVFDAIQRGDITCSAPETQLAKQVRVVRSPEEAVKVVTESYS